MIMAKDLVIGKEYKVVSKRKGCFNMVVVSVNDEWIDGIITNGIADAMCSYNIREEGEKITVRDSLTKFFDVE